MRIEEDIVRQTDAELRQLAGGPYVSVVDFRNAGYADRDGRDYAARATDEVALATAVVFDTMVGEWLLDRWIEESGPQRPVACFTEVTTAVSWASEKAAELLDRL